MRRLHARVQGTTLVELVTSIVIVSIAVFGLILAIIGVTSTSSDPLAERQGTAIAHSYLEEVLLAGFCDPNFLLPGQDCKSQCTGSACGAAACGGTGPLKEAARGLYDDVCDYDGLSDTGPEDRNGNPLPGLGAYTVTVNVQDSGVTLGSPAISSNAGEVVRIDVRVSHAALDSDIVLSTFKTNVR